MAESGAPQLISNRRLVTIAGVIVVITVMAFLWTLRGCFSIPGSGNNGYLTIYTGLDLKDTANVVSRLKDLKIPYEVKENGSAVAVPKGKADDARLGLAEKNLPLGGSVGWEIFNETRMGATDFDRRIQLIRAISGELSRTIKRIKGIEDAYVQIVLPETKLFEVTKAPVTAAVLLKIAPGERLNPQHVMGIVNLVSHSVENLQPENVTIIDNAGNILTAQSNIMEETPKETVLVQKTVQAPVEQEIIKKEEIASLESEKKSVEVKVEEEAKKEIKEIKEEPYLQASKEANLPMIEQLPIVEKKSAPLSDDEKALLIIRAKEEYERQLTAKAQDLLNQFYPQDSIIVRINVIFGEPEKKVKTVKLKINTGTDFLYAAIKQLTVMTLVDENLNLTARVKKSTYQTIARAVDYNKERGDKIILKKVPFHYAQFPKEEEKPKIFSLILSKFNSGLFYIFSGIAVLIVLLVIFIRYRKSKQQGSSFSRNEMPFETNAPTEGEATATVKNIKDMAKNNPEQIANLLKKWLTEGNR